MATSPATTAQRSIANGLVERFANSLQRIGHTITEAEKLTRESGVVTTPGEGAGLVAIDLESSSGSSD